MRKILFTLCMCFALCSCHSQFGIAYGVKLHGDGDGQVQVTFPEGSYAMDGKAAIALQIGDSLPLGKVTTKAYVLQHGSARNSPPCKQSATPLHINSTQPPPTALTTYTYTAS